MYIAHHFMLLRLNPFDLSADRDGWRFEHSVSYLQVSLSAEGAKNNSSWPWPSPLGGRGSLPMAFSGKFICIQHTILSCYCSIPFTLVLTRRNCGLSTLCHSCRSDYQQRVLNFAGLGCCLRSQIDGQIDRFS